MSVLGPRPTASCNVAVRIVAAPSSSKRRPAPRRRDALPAEYGTAAPPDGSARVAGHEGEDDPRWARYTRWTGEGRVTRRGQRREHRSWPIGPEQCWGRDTFWPPRGRRFRPKGRSRLNDRQWVVFTPSRKRPSLAGSCLVASRRPKPGCGPSFKSGLHPERPKSGHRARVARSPISAICSGAAARLNRPGAEWQLSRALGPKRT